MYLYKLAGLEMQFYPYGVYNKKYTSDEHDIYLSEFTD